MTMRHIRTWVEFEVPLTLAVLDLIANCGPEAKNTTVAALQKRKSRVERIMNTGAEH